MDITVYSMPSCMQCRATMRALDKAGLAYRVVDLASDEEALNRVRAMGHAQAPVVVAGDENWSGFCPDRIKALAS